MNADGIRYWEIATRIFTWIGRTRLTRFGVLYIVGFANLKEYGSS
jgi:hypothetical protein